MCYVASARDMCSLCVCVCVCVRVCDVCVSVCMCVVCECVVCVCVCDANVYATTVQLSAKMCNASRSQCVYEDQIEQISD